MRRLLHYCSLLFSLFLVFGSFVEFIVYVSFIEFLHLKNYWECRTFYHFQEFAQYERVVMLNEYYSLHSFHFIIFHVHEVSLEESRSWCPSISLPILYRKLQEHFILQNKNAALMVLLHVDLSLLLLSIGSWIFEKL